MVYWLNLFKTHCVLFTCIYASLEAGPSYILLFTAFLFWKRALSTFATYAFSKTCTSHNVRNGAGRTHWNRAIVQKQIAGFFFTQKSSKFTSMQYKNENNIWSSAVLLCMYLQIIQRLYPIVYTTQNMVQPMYYFFPVHAVKQLKTIIL